ncbi:MATE family efflux transporter [Porphyromonas levii]|uniref:MATE family efflux transporter n=1 Tax=Porphyromonas levii TaxID=28114 RepID=UPI00035EA4D1|nr:MATE family efflux transporter [Porphyromonas levii]MBR8702885.1 Multidrug resistance protein MdtK [Porphyromonas levii]MBR8712561.1 Multidrug resistance protein MdtK [Porphyromonas levii]MBR8714553.1 Multidrug resistance protein MdtK [Porphyromonas levii]MBR8727166.1 Multidrug resistance protein MdtK [Porphyromonas levii]MBR8730407.1 Multidrug resistance protein MdtK [Porphyromonas levii]
MSEYKLDLTTQNILRLSWPVFISLIAQSLIGVVDTAFITRVGEIQLGGTAMGSLVYFSIYTIGWGLASGTQILTSHRYGANNKADIGRVLGQSIKLLILAALTVTTIAIVAGPTLFRGLLSSPRVAETAIEYWTYRSFGFVFAFLSATFRSFFVGIGRTKVLTLNSVVMSIVNIVLDYGLIFGNLGFPEMGVKGAAIASVAAEAASVLFYILYIRFKVDTEVFGINRSSLLALDRQLSKQLFNMSSYLMLQAFVSQSVWAIFFFMLESLGERQLAVASITRQIYVLIFMPMNSYGTSVRTTVGHIVGAGQLEQLSRYMARAVRLSFGTMLIIFTFIQLFPELPLRIFTDNPDLIHDAVATLRVFSLAALIASAGNMYFNAVSSTGNTKMVFLIELINTAFYLVYGAVMVYLLGATVAMCFTVEVIYFLFIGIMSYRYITRLTKSYN